MKNKINKLQGVLFKVINDCYILIIILTEKFTDALSFKDLNKEIKDASESKLKKVANFLNIPGDKGIDYLRFFTHWELGEKCLKMPTNERKPYHIKVYDLCYEVLKILGVNQIKVSI